MSNSFKQIILEAIDPVALSIKQISKKLALPDIQVIYKAKEYDTRIDEYLDAICSYYGSKYDSLDEEQQKTVKEAIWNKVRKFNKTEESLIETDQLVEKIKNYFHSKEGSFHTIDELSEDLARNIKDGK